MDFDVCVKLETFDNDNQPNPNQVTQLVKHEQNSDCVVNKLPNSDIGPKIMVKIEPMEINSCDDELLDFILKEELDIGPTLLHRPVDTSFIENKPEEPVQELMSTIKPNKKCYKKSKKRSERKENKHKDTNTEAKQFENIDSGEKTFICDTCSKVFKHANNFIRHKKEAHDENSIKSLMCNICDRKFKRHYSLVRHQNSNGVRCKRQDNKHEYTCICGKSFKQRPNFNRHRSGYCEKSTKKSGVYICECCGKSFPNRVRMSVHISYHKRTEERGKFWIPRKRKELIVDKSAVPVVNTSLLQEEELTE